MNRLILAAIAALALMLATGSHATAGSSWFCTIYPQFCDDPTPTPPPTPTPTPTPAPTGPWSTIELEVRRLTNVERQEQTAIDGKFRPTLAKNDALARAAETRCTQVANFRSKYGSFFPNRDVDGDGDIDTVHSNIDSNGDGQIDMGFSYTLNLYGVPYRIAGENVATAFNASPSAVMSAWMGSTGHRANILRPAYKRIGVAYCGHWVQWFTDPD